MSPPVVTSDRARRDVIDCCTWWAEHRSHEQAERWYECCDAAIQSLATRAKRCRLAPENSAFPFEVRQFPFGLGRRPSHRLFFTIRPDMIVVLRVQSLAQDFLSPDDV
jgi:plasmid stabilization system protein ParE